MNDFTPETWVIRYNYQDEDTFNVKYLLLRSQKLIQQRDFLRKSYIYRPDSNPSEITVTSIDEKFLKDLIETVKKNIDNPDFNVKVMSDIMGFSHANLYRKIKALTGQTVSEFIRTIRLKEAARLLKSKEVNVSDAMYKVGFTHRSYFTRSFKDMYGVTPKEYISEKTS